MIKQACAYFGDTVLMGAGTVLDPETARAAILAGAQFIVTPALNLKTIKLCQRYGKPIIPGALTPTEPLTAWEAGADMVGVFLLAVWDWVHQGCWRPCRRCAPCRLVGSAQ
jgi:2-dehydro-3-deoxyphosphogluconate aldolase/(4S)-4-hydroxy-2-oxoglutarate aldolase